MADQDPDRRRVIAGVGAAARWRHPDATARRVELCVEKFEKKIGELLADGALQTDRAEPLAARVTQCAARLVTPMATTGVMQVSR